VGGSLALFKWQGRHVGRIVCGGHADAGRDRSSAAPGGHLPGCYRKQLSRKLDLPGGAFEQWFNQSWTSGLSQDTFNRTVVNHTNALGGMWKLPLANYPLFNFSDASAPVSTASLAPYFLDWLAHPSYDPYWKQLSIEEHFGDITVPILHVAAGTTFFKGVRCATIWGSRCAAGAKRPGAASICW
jgi:hypothetical protein